MAKRAFIVKLLLCVTGVSSLFALWQYSTLHTHSASRVKTITQHPELDLLLLIQEDAGHLDDEELTSSEVDKGLGFGRGRQESVPGSEKTEGVATPRDDNIITLARRAWINDPAVVPGRNASKEMPLRVLDTPWENDPRFVDASADKVDLLWDDVVHDNAYRTLSRDVFMPRLTPNVTSPEATTPVNNNLRDNKPTTSQPPLNRATTPKDRLTRITAAKPGIKGKLSTSAIAKQALAGTEVCPLPYEGSECSVTMLGAMGRNITTHSGYISVNYQKVLDWIGKPGIYIVRLSHQCDVQETRSFDIHRVKRFTKYISALPKDTVLIGMSGDYNMLNDNKTGIVLNWLGVNVEYFYRDCIYGFVAKVGYKGVTEWRKQFKNVGPLMFSKGTIKGRTFPVQLHEPTYSQLQEAYREVGQGGHWRPGYCTPRWKVAVVIPFRDRDPHLRIWLNNLVRFLEAQSLEFTIYVIEQAGPELFNRAALMNIGYVEAKRRSHHDCYIFHDVDLIPEDLCNLYACTDHPRHLAVTMNKFSYRMPYDSYFGGAISLTEEHMEEINGFSNVLFGWGGEDDDMALRLNRKDVPIIRYPPELGRYVMIKHRPDDSNPRSHRGMQLIQEHTKYMDVDGLNSLHYKRLSFVMKPLFTHVYVKLQGPTTMDDVPAFYELARQDFIQMLENIALNNTR